MNLPPNSLPLSNWFQVLNPDSPLNQCQNCFARGSINKGSLLRWTEHDDNNHPTQTTILLCRHCSNTLINPHPRLYSELHPNYPVPGSMEICDPCALRKGTSCRSPRARPNGGPGVELTIQTPTKGFIDGKYSGPFQFFPSPASSCQQFTPKS